MADKNLFFSSLLGGGAAGLSVDVALFPLDTLKTRLQAEQGFLKSGGFKGIYRGLGPQAIGSAPQGALFFCTYEGIKAGLEPLVPSYCHPFVHMTAASASEVVACIIRVPLEIVKQRRQTTKEKSLKIFVQAYQNEGVRGLYRGFLSTVIRDVPFCLIQFPILEYLKVSYRAKLKTRRQLYSWEVAVCGSIAGAISAAVTTPLDVVKTRIMLADKSRVPQNHLTVPAMMRIIYSTKGIKGLFAGFIPRVVWISFGGYIFFGSYDFCKSSFSCYLQQLEVS